MRKVVWGVSAAVIACGGVLALAAEEPRLQADHLARMDLSEMQRYGEAYVEEMKDLLSDVLEEVSRASKTNDLARVRCINAVMKPLQGLVRLSEQYLLSLRQAVVTADRSRATQEFVKLTMARNRVREWHAQAKGCGGPTADLVFEGEPQVEMSTDPDLPIFDPRVGLDIADLETDPPPSVSPFY